MRQGCVRRDIMMDLEGPQAYCMFISIGLFPLEMECERAPYDERECAQVRTHTDEGVHEAHDTMGFR